MTKEEIMDIIRPICAGHQMRISLDNQMKLAKAIADEFKNRQVKTGSRAYSMGADGLPIEI